MSKRVALPAAIKAIREAKAGWDPTARVYSPNGDPRFQAGAFATTCLLSGAHLSNIENNRKGVTPEVLNRIAVHLNVPLDAISYQLAEEAAA